MDGTLNESGPGIIASFKYAMDKLDMPIPDDSELGFVIGPPLGYSFERLNVPSDRINEAIGFYREYYQSKGKFINSVYDGITDVLLELKARGYNLHIATSKPDVMTLSILEYFNLRDYFDFIACSSMNETRSKKDEVIAYALENIRNKDLGTILMIGDRYHDIEGAKANGIDSMGVLFGYGDREELQNAGADYIAETPEDILNFL